jgi:PadR family transcriptional regulator, regulatory protein PadR
MCELEYTMNLNARPKMSDELGSFEHLVLLAVLRLGGEAHGGGVQEELERTGERKASVSSIYITLMRLQEKGLVTSYLGDPTEMPGGKARRFFSLEPAGLAALGAMRERLLAMWDGVEGAIPEAGGGRSRD